MPIRVLMVALLCLTWLDTKPQIKLLSGSYTTEDGYYTVTIDFSDNELTLIEPNRTSTYTRLSGNIFRFIHPDNKIDYRIEVINPSTIQTFKPDPASGRFTLKLNHNSTAANSEQFKTYFTLAEKYKQKMFEDKKDAQLWSLCAAAAVARSSMNEEGFNVYAKKIASAIKQIVINNKNCPCQDAIPATIWNSTN